MPRKVVHSYIRRTSQTLSYKVDGKRYYGETGRPVDIEAESIRVFDMNGKVVYRALLHGKPANKEFAGTMCAGVYAVELTLRGAPSVTRKQVVTP